MSRLIDRIMAHHPGELSRLLGPMQPQVFEISNVADYYMKYILMNEAQGNREASHVFPNVAPVFTASWMEFRMQGRPQEAGVLMFAEKWRNLSSEARESFVKTVDLPEGVEWAVVCYPFIAEHKHTFHDLQCQVSFFVDQQGRLLRYAISPSERWPDHMIGHMEKLYIYVVLSPCLLALSFLHCKNVKRVEQIPDAPLSRSHEKKYKRPLVRYHTLEIEPMKQVLQREGRIEETGLKRALHICRGHFATYDEKPLFGKVRGTFWKEAHVRGSKKEGLVLKDYKVNEPAGE